MQRTPCRRLCAGGAFQARLAHLWPLPRPLLLPAPPAPQGCYHFLAWVTITKKGRGARNPSAAPPQPHAKPLSFTYTFTLYHARHGSRPPKHRFLHERRLVVNHGKAPTYRGRRPRSTPVGEDLPTLGADGTSNGTTGKQVWVWVERELR